MKVVKDNKAGQWFDEAGQWFDEAGQVDKEKFAELTNRHAQEAAKKFDEAIEAKVKQRLEDFCVEFGDREEFHFFCKEHVSRVTYEDRPHYVEFWLYFGHEHQQYLFFAKTEIKTEVLNGEIITTIG